nr:phage tail assembly chaperone [uncultured Brevundimonas sp.]
MTDQIATPWGEMLRIAAQMGVTPEGFWRLSLKEWRMLSEAPRGAAPMGRTTLKSLMEDWPDGG